MAKSNNAFIKKLKAEKKKKKRDEKLRKKIDKKNNETSGALEDMIAYVDEDGNITTEPIEENDPPKPDDPGSKEQ